MRNAISAELMKARKNRIFKVCALIPILIAAFCVFRVLVLVDPPKTYSQWLTQIYLITGFIFPIMSGFVITFMIQREYEDKTIINVLTAPTSRIIFLLSKLVVWFIWYAAVMVIMEVIYVVGGFLIYPDEFGAGAAKQCVITLTKYGLFSFVACVPLLWVVVRQKRMFYPALMVTLAFTIAELAALIMPMESAVLLPWAAATYLSLYETASPYNAIGMVSIFIAGITGALLAYATFIKQDQ